MNDDHNLATQSFTHSDAGCWLAASAFKQNMLLLLRGKARTKSASPLVFFAKNNEYTKPRQPYKYTPRRKRTRSRIIHESHTHTSASTYTILNIMYAYTLYVFYREL